MKKQPKSSKILSRKATLERTGLTEAMRRQLVRQGKFPTPIRLSQRITGHIEDDVDAWIAARIAASQNGGWENKHLKQQTREAAAASVAAKRKQREQRELKQTQAAQPKRLAIGVREGKAAKEK